MIRPISSPQNESFKTWKLLSTSKGIRKHQSFFLVGEKLIKEFLKKPNFEILAEVMGPQHRTLLEGRAYDFVPKYQLPQPLFDEVDVVGTHFNLLLLKLPEIPKVTLSEPKGLELVLPLGDPGNLGAALRSACAFGVQKVYLTEEAALPFHPKAIKSSAGASLKLQFSSTEKLAAVLQKAPAKSSLALDQNGKSISRLDWPRNVFLFVGEEGPGLPNHDLPVISIPTADVESLNAAVAISIATYAYNQKQSR